MPQPTASTVLVINVLSIDKICPANPFGQRSICTGYGEQMDMVRHQTIGPNINVPFFAVMLQGIKVEAPVFIIEEDVCSIIAPLSNMVGIVDCTDSCDPWHGSRIIKQKGVVNA